MVSLLRRKFLSPLLEFLHDSRAVGIILIVATLLSMVLANTAFSDAYTSFWTRPFDPHHSHHLEIAGLQLPNSPLLWINDGLMAFFFFLVGMEIKRELTIGELSSLKNRCCPLLLHWVAW
ncbi:Na+/H+ antiporter NhaA [Chitinophaga sedimenti]|nr:Na+/H+ antiporter NhaA [Chitinophaga sedimenti]MCK7553921.1 Na+/H+ antiporter NhaA [Chitinophaga sedimenti]